MFRLILHFRTRLHVIIYTRVEEVCVSVRRLYGDSRVDRCNASCIYSDIIYSTWPDKFVSELHTSRYLQLAYLSPILSLCTSNATRNVFSLWLLYISRLPPQLALLNLFREMMNSRRLPSQSAAIINNKISKPTYISLIIHGTILTRAQS